MPSIIGSVAHVKFGRRYSEIFSIFTSLASPEYIIPALTRKHLIGDTDYFGAFPVIMLYMVIDIVVQ
jgi:hypothetical protein